MRDKLTEILRSVPITDKTYSEYIEAVADAILANERNVAREVLALVWDAYQTTHYDSEFEERLDNIEKKYTEEGK